MCLAVPGKIIEISGEDPMLRSGKIDFGGIFKEASLAYLPEAVIGNYVIVHAGFALSILDEEEAKKTLEYLSEIDALNQAEEETA